MLLIITQLYIAPDNGPDIPAPISAASVLHVRRVLGRSMSGSVELDKKVEEWLSWDRNEQTREEVRDLVRRGCHNELSKVLLTRISFGTAGLRGKMGAGYGCMNDLVVIQAGQGLLGHLEETSGAVLKENGIVVGYDGRHNSKR